MEQVFSINHPMFSGNNKNTQNAFRTEVSFVPDKRNSNTGHQSEDDGGSDPLEDLRPEIIMKIEDRSATNGYLHKSNTIQPSNTSSPSSSIVENFPLRIETATSSDAQTASTFRQTQKNGKRLVIQDDLTLLSSKRIMKERFELLKSIIDVRMLRGERPLYDSEIPKDMLALLTNPAEANL